MYIYIYIYMYIHIMLLHHSCVNRQDGSINWPSHFGPRKFHRLDRLVPPIGASQDGWHMVPDFSHKHQVD